MSKIINVIFKSELDSNGIKIVQFVFVEMKWKVFHVLGAIIMFENW